MEFPDRVSRRVPRVPSLKGNAQRGNAKNELEAFAMTLDPELSLLPAPTTGGPRLESLPLGGTIGIDPGKSGGVAYVASGGVAVAWKMPKTERDLWELVRALAQRAEHAMVERVHSMPGNGRASMFTFGVNYGACRLALAASGVAWSLVQPAVWQRAMGCLTRGDKQVTYARAQALFPRCRVTHAVADALLIAQYCRLQHVPVDDLFG